MSSIFAQEMVVLFCHPNHRHRDRPAIFRGFSLGAVGVLFTAMVFGHFGLTIPRGVMDLACCYLSTPLACRLVRVSFAPFAGMASSS